MKVTTPLAFIFFAGFLLGSASSPQPVWAYRQKIPSADPARQRQFAHLWEQRFVSDVSAELLPFVDDQDDEAAQRAVRALGRLEQPGVLSELGKRRDAQKAQMEAGREDVSKLPTRYIDYDTAIARIQSRTLHGQEKIEFVLKNSPSSWSWQKAIGWSKKFNAPLFSMEVSRPEFQNTAASLREIVDMLYLMSKRGEDVESLRQQFTFSKAQNIQLEGAKLSPEQEAEHILDYSQTLDIVGGDDEYVCEAYLLSLGEPARVALKRRMELLLQTKPTFTNRNPFICMLRASAMTGDKTFIPIVEAFGTTMHYVERTTFYAQQAQNQLSSTPRYSFAPQ